MKKAFKILLFIYIIGSAVYIFNNQFKDIYLDNQLDNDNKEALSMMLETEAGSGKYQETTRSSWPEDGYVFNETLSKCEKGSSLSWDNSKKSVVMIGTNADKCYVYFDKELDVLTFAYYIKKMYTTQGENNLYFHDNTLAGGANDNSYRYSGSSETTNNFVCFGYDSTDGTCPTDNLYRIIGVFDDQVKLIKYDYANSNLLGTDGEHYSYTYSPYDTYKGELESIDVFYFNIGNTHNNVWNESKLNTINLNTNYLNNIGSTWANKISTYTWKTGGNTKENFINVSASLTYQNEIVSPADETIVQAKVGLMYVSDYGYALSPSLWGTSLEYYSNVTDDNWMYMGMYDWTITKKSDTNDMIFNVWRTGKVYYNHYGSTYSKNDYYYLGSVRPCFYLNSDVTYKGGKGTKSEPFLIE